MLDRNHLNDVDEKFEHINHQNRIISNRKHSVDKDYTSYEYEDQVQINEAVIMTKKWFNISRSMKIVRTLGHGSVDVHF